MVIGELACGNVSNRTEVFKHASGCCLSVPVASDGEVLFFIEYHQLMGRGIGYIDAHLLASAAMSSTATQLWSKDRRLMEIANELGVAYGQP